MTIVLEAKGLTKSFRRKIANDSKFGAFKDLFSARYEELVAVDNIDLQITEGECVAVIGPNGAGKSTALKMLTGILHPTSGHAKVLGFTPWEQRKRLSYKIGTVFGQKSQLWYHLPPHETFKLLGSVYDIPQKRLEQRTRFLVQRFGIEEFLHVAVRKLSLGQRVRAELVASLLHEPKIVFLDEPSIGLDVIAKKNLRQLLVDINREEKTTIILTSHDMDDIEHVCSRVIVINHGIIIEKAPLSDLKKRYVTKKLVRISLNKPHKKKTHIEKATVLKHDDFLIELEVAPAHIKSAIHQMLSLYDVADVEILNPGIEDIIEQIYSRKRE